MSAVFGLPGLVLRDDFFQFGFDAFFVLVLGQFNQLLDPRIQPGEIVAVSFQNHDLLMGRPRNSLALRDQQHDIEGPMADHIAHDFSGETKNENMKMRSYEERSDVMS